MFVAASTYRRALLAGGVVFLLAMLLLRSQPQLVPPSIDLLQYWGAAQLFLGHQNPYDPALIQALEVSAGYREEIIRMWNPPAILPLIFPLARAEFASAAVVWCCLSIALFAGCFALLAQLYGLHRYSTRERWQLWTLLFLFSPFFECLGMGQISAVLMFGVCGWWLAFSTSGLQSIAAGIFLGITVIKPHLLLPIYIGIALLSLRARQYRMISSFVLTALALTSLAYLYEPRVVGWYATAMSDPPIYWRTPNLGSFLQALTGVHSIWVRLTPQVFTIVAVMLFAWGYRLSIEPQALVSYFSVLLPLSLLVSPYGWAYDQMVLLPLLFQIVLVDWRKSGASLRRWQFLILLFGQVAAVLLPAAWGQERGITLLLGYAIVVLFNFSRQFDHVDESRLA